MGITDLKPELADVITEAELKDWQQLPPGTIIVVDECQRYMPTRRTGDAPKWIADLSTHRHLGLDFILITQHPALIDPYVRRLADRHVHTVRKFGTHWVERWAWPEVQSDPTSRMSQRAVEKKTRAKYSKLAMQAYTSSELHTVKRRIPPFIFIGSALVLIVPFLGWAAVRILHHAGKTAVPGAVKPASSLPHAPAGTDAHAVHKLTRSEWIAERVPRVPGIPWSAPMWDNLPVTTTPDLYCIIIKRPTGTDCGCITEQGTKAVVPRALCKQYATDGVYNPYRAKPAPPSGPKSSPSSSSPSSPRGPASSVAFSAGAGKHGQGVPPGKYVPPTYGPWNPQALDGSQSPP